MIGEPITKALLISTAPKLWPQRAAHVLIKTLKRRRPPSSHPRQCVAGCQASLRAYILSRMCARACVRVRARQCTTLEASPRQLSHIPDQSVDDAPDSRSLRIIDQTGRIEYGINRWRARPAVQMSPNSHRIKESSGVLYSLGPWCFRGASRSLGARSSDEFSRDSAPWSSLTFFAELQPPHSLTLLFFLGISQEENAGVHRNEFALK